MLPLVLIAITALTLIPILATATGSTTVSVDPSSLTGVLPGSTFSVDIVVTDVTDMYGYEFKLNYDTRVLTATAISLVGNILEPGYFPWKQEINDALTPVTGRVWCAVTQELGAVGGVSGSGLLATITFSVDALGVSDLDLYDVELRDPDGALITTEVSDGYFSTYPIVSVDPALTVNPALGVGATFDVDIVITEVTDMYGYEFKLNYDTRVLTATAISLVGNILEPGYFPWKQEINDALTPVTGRVWCAVTQELGAVGGVSGSGLLATITFSVDALGVSDLDLYDVELRDPDGALIIPAVTDGDFTNTVPILWTKIKTKNPYPDWSLGHVGEDEILYCPVKNTGDRGVLVSAQFIIRHDATGDTVSELSDETPIQPGTVVTLSTDPFPFDIAGTYHFSIVLWFRIIDDLPPEPYYLYEDLLGGAGISKAGVNRINVKA